MSSWPSSRGATGAYQHALAVTVDIHGDVLATGHFAGAVDFFDGALKQAGQGHDVYLVKLGKDDGKTIWAKSFGSSGSDELSPSVAADGAGNVVLLAGTLIGGVDFGGGLLSSQGNVDFAIAKLDPSGNHLWSHRFAGAGDQVGYEIAVDALGRIVMTGNNLVGTPNFGGGPLVPTGGRAILVAGFAP
jgi:outer membrane protein assembly factor BamB